MDILKVLSRGTKQPPKGPGKNSSNVPPAKLPSAGGKPHPQLFHDKVRSNRAQKRKRDSEDDDEENSSMELPEVDFFAQKEEDKPTHTKNEDRSERDDAVEEDALPPPKELDVEECREVLKSHRLKIMLLSKPPSSVAGSKTSKKKQTKADRITLYPQPLTSFAELRQVYNISSRVAENLVKEGYKVPTEVQMGSLPLLLKPDFALGGGPDASLGPKCVPSETSVDFMAVAPTGSGKTISFLVPAINSIMRRRAREKIRGAHELEAVVVAPTRELAFQIVNEGRKLAMGTGLKVVLMKKGMRVMTQGEDGLPLSKDDESDEADDDSSDSSDSEGGKRTKKKLAPGSTTQADILVTTPMPLVNFLNENPSQPPKSLKTVRTLILDEADVLLDPLFLEQTMGIWDSCHNTGLQTSFWSATMPSSIEDQITSQLGRRAEDGSLDYRPLVRLVVGLKDTAVPNVTHKLIYAGSENGKLLTIRQLLRPRSLADPSVPPLRPPFLVFTQTIERAAALESELKYDIPLEAGGPSRIASLHSGLSDAARSQIMRRFRAGEIWVLITTDVLARGVDFAGVNGVVNYDVPTSSAAYVHRAGRTGRAGREGGIAVTLYTKDDIPYVKTVANVIAASDKQAGKTGDQASIQKWLLDALPHVSKNDKKRLKERGVESRRSGAKAKITSRSGYERQKENNRKGAIEGSKRRKQVDGDDGPIESYEEWGGFDD